MSDLGECCYGMGFGPEGDGVELAARDAMGLDKLFAAYARMNRRKGSFENIQWPQWAFEDKPESTAKPSLPALTRQAGEKYKGPLAFCHADN